MKYFWSFTIIICSVLTSCSIVYGNNEISIVPDATQMQFDNREELSENELEKLISELTSLINTGNLNANVLLATIEMERLAILDGCIQYSSSCKGDKYAVQLREQEKNVYDLLKTATEKKLGLYEFAIFLRTNSSTFYSPEESTKYMTLAANNLDERAINFLIESYQFGENGFQKSTEMQEFWINKLEQIDDN